MNKNKIIIGISGASGVILGIELLKTMQLIPQWETHLVISKDAEKIISLESDYTINEIIDMAYKFYKVDDFNSSIASGTFKTEGMVIIPCSMKTIAGISNGYCDNLLLRSADVTLKEKRKLVLVTRESPLSIIHLKNMLSTSKAGAVIIPPMLSFYHKPNSIKDLINNILGKVLDQFGIYYNEFVRWNGQ